MAHQTLIDSPVQGIAPPRHVPHFCPPMKLALVGNPNCGKTTLFNQLTGSKGKVGNMPGVTVDSSRAAVRFETDVELVDLPGTYSLHATTPDERVTQAVLLDPKHPDHPDVVLCVVEAAALRSSLFLVSQILDWGFPTILVVNETDATRYEQNALERGLGIPVIGLNAAHHEARSMWSAIKALKAQQAPAAFAQPLSEVATAALRSALPYLAPAQATHLLRRGEVPAGWGQAAQEALDAARDLLGDGPPPSPSALQLDEAGERMAAMRPIADAALGTSDADPEDDRTVRMTTQVDAVLTHPVWGNLILMAVFFGLFQAVYAWSDVPMGWIDLAFSRMTEAVAAKLPEAWWSSLLVDGLLAGIGGIVVFVPQIMILFGLTSALESTGYMARVGFLGDRFLQRIGLNGRSIVPLVGGLACAVPAVLAARTIPGRRERLLTILITPLMTCSARLPVYAFLIAFVVPDTKVWGVFNQQGLFLFGLYAASMGAALLLSFILHRTLPKRTEGGFTLEWPVYRWPAWRYVGTEMLTKAWTFVHSAGKVILLVSLALWGLARFGPSEAMHAAEQETGAEREAALLEASYIGQLGQWIEPVVQPLGYDGRMGIAILTSFAAREVFVGTLSTLYPAPSSDEGNIAALQRTMAAEINPRTGKPLLNSASALSLIVFYMFALQCMSTVATVQRELDSWIWALGQAVAFSAIAYGLALLTFQVFA